jgi:hypothetical protein
VVAVKFCLRHYQRQDGQHEQVHAKLLVKIIQIFETHWSKLLLTHVTRVEANGLLKKFNSLDIRFMTVFRDEIMKRYITRLAKFYKL